jgi:hypothetical protein
MKTKEKIAEFLTSKGIKPTPEKVYAFKYLLEEKERVKRSDLVKLLMENFKLTIHKAGGVITSLNKSEIVRLNSPDGFYYCALKGDIRLEYLGMNLGRKYEKMGKDLKKEKKKFVKGAKKFMKKSRINASELLQDLADWANVEEEKSNESKKETTE